MTIAITGVTGNMGQAVLDAVIGVDGLNAIKLLVRSPKRVHKLLNHHKKFADKVQLIHGDMTDKNALKQLVTDSDLVINLAAVIPPRSDKNPQSAVACNESGVDILVGEIEKSDKQPALIHTSSVAVYGNRSGGHPYGRVGDPLPASPLCVYTATKLRGEMRVLESNIEKWAILRQSAMLHPKMLSDNIHDGLMFHTTFDAPLEWVTAHDSGLLIKHIVQKFISNAMPDNFWRRVFNIGGSKENRKYGIQIFDEGFAIIGGGARQFFRPVWSATRNFHGVWYLDGDELNNMFDYITQTTEEYWKSIFESHPWLKLGRLVPKCLIRRFLFERLQKDSNAPTYWAKHNDEARLIAYFGGRAKYDELAAKSWEDIGEYNGDGVRAMEDNAEPVYYGFDFSKPDGELTQADLEGVAKAHGGELLGTFDGDMYKKLEWKTQDGEIFSARPYTVLRAGHWFNPIYKSFVWDFDRLAKKDKILASIWYDTHDKDENIVYSLDENYKAVARRFR